MVLDALRGYLQLANGLTDVTRQRAVAAARALAAQGGAQVEQVVPGQLPRQVQSLAEELVATSRANRDLLVKVVRSEVDKAVARLGVGSGEEIRRLRHQVERLELRITSVETAAATGLPAGRAAPRSTAKRSTAKKSTAKKSPAKKATAKRSAAKRSAAKASA